MANSDQTSRILKADVGNNRTNNPDDVMRVKKILSHFGLYDLNQSPEPHGYMTADADVAIRRFQGVKGLKVDGYLLPDGETEREMLMPNIIPLTRKFRTHYAEGSGKAIDIDRKYMDTSAVYKNAIEVNRSRFENSITKGDVDGKPHEFRDKILKLKDGETILLSKRGAPEGTDYWDRDIGRFEGVAHGDFDQAFSVGRAKLRSTGSLKAIRKGDKVLVEGFIDHRLKDTYDFNEKDYAYTGLRNMKKSKSFEVQGSKLEKLNGEVSIEHGTIKDQKFRWNPILETDSR